MKQWLYDHSDFLLGLATVVCCLAWAYIHGMAGQ